MKTRPEVESEIVRLHHAEGWPVGTIGRQMSVHSSVVMRVLGQADVVATVPAAADGAGARLHGAVLALP